MKIGKNYVSLRLKAKQNILWENSKRPRDIEELQLLRRQLGPYFRELQKKFAQESFWENILVIRHIIRAGSGLNQALWGILFQPQAIFG